jgi:DNA repair exonuclease SbcCD ATPase subunit
MEELTHRLLSQTLELRYQESQFQSKRQNEQRNEAVRRLQEEVQHEKKVGVLLQKKLSECVAELEELQAAEQRLAESVTGKEKLVCLSFLSSSDLFSRQTQESTLPLLEKIEDLKEEIVTLKAKEQKLMQEIKKRGDLARQLCGAKDEEIKQLREKLHFDQRQHQALSSSSSLLEEQKKTLSSEAQDEEQKLSSNGLLVSSQQEEVPPSCPPPISSPITRRVSTEPTSPNSLQLHQLSDQSSPDGIEEEVSLPTAMVLLIPFLSGAVGPAHRSRSSSCPARF